MSLKMKIKKGDQVIVIAGDDKGKTGEVVKAMPSEGKVVVQGVNLVKRHTKPAKLPRAALLPRKPRSMFPMLQSLTLNRARPAKLVTKKKTEKKSVSLVNPVK